MAFKAEMTSQHSEIIGPSWPLAEDVVDALMDRLMQADWFGEQPDRVGFSEIRRFAPAVVVGYFAVEKPITIVTYDTQRQMHEHEEESFEHIWLALLLEEGRLLAQRRRFIHRDLNASEVLRRLETSLASLFGAVDIPISEFRPFERHVTKQEFLEEFSRGGVTEIQIDSLHGSRVPEGVRLFNPDIDRDAILKEAYDHDNQEISELTAKAGQAGDLSKTRLFKAEAQAGDPRYLKREEEDGIIVRERKVTDRPTFVVTQIETRVLPTDEEIAEIIAVLKGLPRPRRRREPTAEGQETLFEGRDESGE